MCLVASLPTTAHYAGLPVIANSAQIITCMTSAVNTAKFVPWQNSVTDFKMAVNRYINQLYKHVRDMGLPYEIKESGGSVIIKISADTNNSFRKKEDKFRFHNKNIKWIK